MTADPAPPRRRDAAKTRQLLLDAARRRFARDGYAATTVRDIAEDAEVNVALINRYFESKEGLFAACLTATVDELRRTPEDLAPDRIPAAIAAQVAGSATQGQPNPVLLMLLRSSGDERADQIRRDVLCDYSERLALAAGHDPGDPGSLLRAQLMLAAATGMTLMRVSGLQPLAAATEQDLVGPLRDVINALLPPP